MKTSSKHLIPNDPVESLIVGASSLIAWHKAQSKILAKAKKRLNKYIKDNPVHITYHI